MVESIYLKALEYSSNKPFEGVTFKELQNHITENFGENFNSQSLTAFFKFILDTHYWTSSQIGTNPTKDLSVVGKFHDCFKEELNPGNLDISAHKDVFEQFTKKEKYFINGEGDKRLMDFYELRDARINAKKAFYFSIIAIIISSLALLLSPIIERLWNIILCY